MSKRLTCEELDSIPYVDENRMQIDIMGIERDEQLLARKWVPADAKVLELGARYGTVSCNISARLDDPTRHIAVEPDPRVIDALQSNKATHNASFNIYKGVVSRKPVSLNTSMRNGYCVHTEECNGSSSSPVATLTMEELEAMYKITFDTLVADCEGALESFFDENLQALSNFRIVMFEKDRPHACNYDKIETYLKDWGFICEDSANDGFHVVWTRMSK